MSFSSAARIRSSASFIFALLFFNCIEISEISFNKVFFLSNKAFNSFFFSFISIPAFTFTSNGEKRTNPSRVMIFLINKLSAFSLKNLTASFSVSASYMPCRNGELTEIGLMDASSLMRNFTRFSLTKKPPFFLFFKYSILSTTKFSNSSPIFSAMFSTCTILPSVPCLNLRFPGIWRDIKSFSSEILYRVSATSCDIFSFLFSKSFTSFCSEASISFNAPTSSMCIFSALWISIFSSVIFSFVCEIAESIAEISFSFFRRSSLSKESFLSFSFSCAIIGATSSFTRANSFSTSASSSFSF